MFRTAFAAALATAIAATAANAVTVRNDDMKTASIVFTPMHGKKQLVSLRHHHHKSFDCSMGGTVTLGNSTLECSAKTAKITIKGGKLVI